MSELIRQFGVDWKLLLAQAVNFSLLIFLLSKFAYRPILAMLKKRREDIEKGIRFTREAEETARTRKDEIALEAVKKSEQIVEEARRAIRQEKAKMMERAYMEAEGMMRTGIAAVLGRMPAEKRDADLIREAVSQLKTARHNSV